MNTENLVQELRSILPGAKKHSHMLQEYDRLRNLLQAGGHASAAAARLIIDALR
jgi:hypothetical protein